MAVKKFYSNKAKPGWRWDAVKNQYSSWGFDIRKSNGQRKRESGFGTRQLAEAAVARIRLSEKNSKYELVEVEPSPTLIDLRNKRIEAVADHREKVRSERVLTVLHEALARRGIVNPRLIELTPGNMSCYAELRRTEGVSDATINRELRTLRASLNQAPMFFAELDNWTPPKVRYLQAPKTRRERVVNSIEGRSILFHLLKPQLSSESRKIFHSRRRAGLLFILSAVSGARPGELVSLKETDILPDIGMLRITGKKTRYKTSKTVRYFPLLDVVKQILKEAIEIKAGDFIFSQKGTLTETYYAPIRQACERAGVAYGRKIAGGFIPYDLRHTATTLLVQSGADIETVSSITGQSHYSLWHYTHASQESVARAAGVLGDFARNLLKGSKDGLGLDSVELAGKVSA